MKSLLFAMSLLAALGTASATASATTSQSMATLALSQNLGQPALAMTLGTGSSTNSSARSPQPLAATPPAEAAAVEGAGFELESGLLLALAGVMALLIVARRRLPR